jgi:hypothetical protein
VSLHLAIMGVAISMLPNLRHPNSIDWIEATDSTFSALSDLFLPPKQTPKDPE